jgi:hypothetical protein
MRALVLLAALLAGCVTAPAPEVPATAVARFSSNSAIGECRRAGDLWSSAAKASNPNIGWCVIRPISRSCSHAHADASASGLRQLLDVDPAHWPIVDGAGGCSI